MGWLPIRSSQMTHEPAVLITGAAGALGRAVAKAFEEAGWRLALVDQNQQALAAAYSAEDARRLLLAIDLLDAAAAVRAAHSAIARFGRIAALCNLAGGFDMGPQVHETTPAQWQRMQDLNVHTLLNCVRAVVPQMLAAGGGKIVNVAAIGGLAGRPRMGAYSASKSAVIRLTEAMAAELREQGVNVNCVLPSILDTPANRAALPEADFGKWVAPADLAAVILFLCSEVARAIHGAAIPVVGLS
jgi:NAD(P)-dependent dehydrogenase (short-subunit alcohol dehydrogenase family)